MIQPNLAQKMLSRQSNKAQAGPLQDARFNTTSPKLSTYILHILVRLQELSMAKIFFSAETLLWLASGNTVCKSLRASSVQVSAVELHSPAQAAIRFRTGRAGLAGPFGLISGISFRRASAGCFAFVAPPTACSLAHLRH